MFCCRPRRDEEGGRGPLVVRKFKKIEQQYTAKKILLVEAGYRYDKFVASKMSEGSIWDIQLSNEDMAEIAKIAKKEITQELEVWQDGEKYCSYYFSLDVMWRDKKRKLLLDGSVTDPKELEEIREEKKAEFKHQIVKPLTIKLLLTNLPDDGVSMLDHITKRLKKIVAQSISPYGLNHAALQLGPYIIDWNESGIIIPRWMSSANSTLLIPVRDDEQASVRFNALPKICKKIVEWNVNWKYTNLTFNTSKKLSNCQDFVLKMLEFLDIQPNWKKGGFIDVYINKIKEGAITGDELKIWDVTDNCKQVTFEDHDALADWWHSRSLENRDPELVVLVKCIERVFQMRFAATGDPKYLVADPIFGPRTGAF